MAEAVNRSLQRGLQLLELLSEHPEGMELHEICKALELPKSSGHNLLQQLVQSRYVWVSSHGKYRLTLKTFEVGASAVHATEISQVLRQYMQEVFAVCNETMHCGVLSGREVLYIDKIESTQSIRMASHVGIRMPLYATAMGKAFLAAMPGRSGAHTFQRGLPGAPDRAHHYQSGSANGAAAGDPPNRHRRRGPGKRCERQLHWCGHLRPGGEARLRIEHFRAKFSGKRCGDQRLGQAAVTGEGPYRACTQGTINTLTWPIKERGSPQWT